MVKVTKCPPGPEDPALLFNRYTPIKPIGSFNRGIRGNESAEALDFFTAPDANIRSVFFEPLASDDTGRSSYGRVYRDKKGKTKNRHMVILKAGQSHAKQ